MLALLLLAAGCAGFPGTEARDGGASGEGIPALPPASGDTLTLVLAGAPLAVFGDEAAPDYEAAFQRFADAGFDLFFPFFGLSERLDERGNPYNPTAPLFQDFFAPGAPWAAPDRHCGLAGPYRAARGRLKILVPLFLFDPSPTQPLDAERLIAEFEASVAPCLEGDLSVVGGFDLYDEPVTSYLASSYEGRPVLDLDNVARMAGAIRSRYPERPLYLVEAPLPVALEWNDNFGLSDQDAAQLVQRFWSLQQRTAPHADVYGYDLYPIPVTTDLSLIGEWVRHAREQAPGARPSATLQGFGFADQTGQPDAGRRPTPEENRAAAYLALVEGARSIAWWGQSMMDLGATDDRLWRSILSTALELAKLEGMLGWEQVALGITGVPGAAWSDGETVHLILVNPTSEPAVADLVWNPPVCRIWDRDASPGGALIAEGRTVESHPPVAPRQVLRWTARLCR